ncbi:hypothetical protein BGY98DRAFT_616944 [Russula aff. rugulosa BPL654]|nr:hypothetical protein BGY98DRAFT_616944 [Russula aff. rugulosa BPL654]
MGCPTKIAKVITIPLSSLLIALCTVSLSAIPTIIQTINDRMSQGLDIQLEILQTLLTVIRTIRKRTCFAPSLLPRATRLLSFEDLCPLGASAIPTTQVPPQDVYYRADRERTYELLPALPEAFRALTLITTPLLPPCSSNRSPNAPLSRLRSALKTETKISLTPLIKLIIGETAGGPRSGLMLMRALAMEIMRRLCSDIELMCSVRQRYDALATGGGASSASSAHVLTLLISAHKNLVTSRPACSASLRGCTEWELLTSDSQSHLCKVDDVVVLAQITPVPLIT